jgi:hypothetical protein
MSPTHPKKGPANIPVKTAIHVNYAVMIAAAYALAKNPATVKNIRKINWTMSKPVLNLRCYVSYHKSAQLKNFPIR